VIHGHAEGGDWTVTLLPDGNGGLDGLVRHIPSKAVAQYDHLTPAAFSDCASTAAAALGGPRGVLLVETLLGLAWRRHVVATEAATAPGAAPTRFRLLTVAELLARPDPADVIGGLLPVGTLAMLFGRPGAGKSFLALDWALHVACGAAAWHALPIGTPGPVVYIVAEGRHAFHRRVAAWLAAQQRDDVARIRFVYDAVQLLDAVDSAALVAAITAWEPQPVLVVVDTLHASMPGGEENSAKDCGLVLQSLGRLRDATGTVVLLLHHPMKHGDAERGSGALRGAMDVMLKVEATGSALTLTWDKVKDGPTPDPLALRLRAHDGSAIVIDDSAGRDPRRLSETEEQALDALRAIAVAGGVSCSQWQDASTEVPHGKGGAVLGRGTFFRARKRLLDLGYAVLNGNRYFPAEQLLPQASTEVPPSTAQVPRYPGTGASTVGFPPLVGGNRGTKYPRPPASRSVEQPGWPLPPSHGDAWEPPVAVRAEDDDDLPF
jgi:hypothetical protein